MPAVREAVVDGLFYPAAPGALRAQIVDCLVGAAAADDAGRAPKLLISPHAGCEYCGAVAAHAYARLGRASARGIRRVVLLGPAHRLALDGLAAPDAQAFETPLGRVAVDLAALAALDELPQLTRSDRAHEGEHSIEVQLPFLQTRLGSGFTLVPLVVGAAQAADRATAFRILALDAGLAPHEACGAAAIKGALLAAGRHGLAAGLLAGRRCPTAQGLRSGLSLTASASARIGRSEGTALAAA